MATSSDMNPGYEPLEADLCITKSWQRDQVMGITSMVQTKKKEEEGLLSFQKCTIIMLSNPPTWALCYVLYFLLKLKIFLLNLPTLANSNN